jgi:hypothetical protein
MIFDKTGDESLQVGMMRLIPGSARVLPAGARSIAPRETAISLKSPPRRIDQAFFLCNAR